MKKLLLPLLIASLSFGLFSCGEKPTSEVSSTPTSVSESKTLEYLSLNGDYKTTFYLDDPFDKTGLQVYAHYSDDSSERVFDYRCSGFESETVGEKTITVTYEGKSITYTVNVIELVEVKIDVTITVSVSGIEDYRGNHSNIYLNGTIVAPGWDTVAMVQDENNPNLWSVTINDVVVDQAYEYNFFYGNDKTPNWTKGKNESETENRSITIYEDSTEVNLDASFVVPTESGTVDVDLVINPVVKPTIDSEEVLNEITYVWAWEESTNETSKFTKGEDGKFHKTYTVTLDGAGTGSLHYTAVLGTEDAPNWAYQVGAYENGNWVKWDTGRTDNSITAETTTLEYTEYFKDQPKEVVASEAYTVVFTLVVPEGSLAEGYGLMAGNSTDTWGNGNAWIGNFELDPSAENTYTFTYSQEQYETITYRIEGWSSSWGNNNCCIGLASDWSVFTAANLVKGETRNITITVSDPIVSATGYTGVVQA